MTLFVVSTSALNFKVIEIKTNASERRLKITCCAHSAVNGSSGGTSTSADPAVSWLRARQLCHLGSHAPESGDIIGILQRFKDYMCADGGPW